MQGRIYEFLGGGGVSLKREDRGNWEFLHTDKQKNT